MQFPPVAYKLCSVVLDDKVVVVHHSGERLPDDKRQPDAYVARAGAHANLQLFRYEDQRNLETERLLEHIVQNIKFEGHFNAIKSDLKHHSHERVRLEHPERHRDEVLVQDGREEENCDLAGEDRMAAAQEGLEHVANAPTVHGNIPRDLMKSYTFCLFQNYSFTSRGYPALLVPVPVSCSRSFFRFLCVSRLKNLNFQNKFFKHLTGGGPPQCLS
jgi:hypothetical protein